MTFKELGMQNLTFDDIKLGYIDKQMSKAVSDAMAIYSKGLTQILTATEGQSVFVIDTSYTPGLNQVTVAVDGVNQLAESYTETDTSSITLSEGLPAGAKVAVTINK
jgi:hypothetical protein